MTRWIQLSVLVVAIGSVPMTAWAFSSGPPDGIAGEPPLQSDCTLCHTSFDVNSGDGALDLLGVPETLVAGTTYDLTLRLSDPGQSRWGFELTVLDAQNEGTGNITVTEAVNTQLSDAAPPTPDYLKQTSDGTFQGVLNGPVEWSFQWTAANTEPATFYVAGNAADSNGSPSNDYIYTTSVKAGTATPVEPVTWGRIKSTFGG